MKMTVSNAYHIPVLLHAAVDGLNISPGDNFVDATFGGGGHSREIIKNLSSGKLIGFDQDPDARKNILTQTNFVFVPQNFTYLHNYLKFHNLIPVAGILADLGVSSHQFDDGERGFSFRYDSKLDMRMNFNQKLSAADVVNNYEDVALRKIFKTYGELNNAHQITRRIIDERSRGKIETTFQLLNALQGLIPQKNEKQILAQIFQALRIEVNGELDVLEDFLMQTIKCLKPGGRLVVISYHSLEDRLVKNFMRSGNINGEVEKDFYGNVNTPFDIITKKPIIPTAEEIEQNPRARSAKLRIAQKR